MVKKVVWSKGASLDRNEIISYWNNRNRSTAYGIKLRLLINEAIKTIQLYPKIGKPTSKLTIRVKIVKNYFIVYQEIQDNIRIIAIWDCRQNPIKLEDKLK